MRSTRRTSASKTSSPPPNLASNWKESCVVLRATASGTAVVDLIRKVRERGLAVILISHDIPTVFDVADRVHIQRLGRRVAVVRPGDVDMAEAVAIMTGAAPGNDPGLA